LSAATWNGPAAAGFAVGQAFVLTQPLTTPPSTPALLPA
jgi:hypothetical protein